MESTLAEPHGEGAQQPEHVLEIVSLTWRRIQVTLRARPATAGFDPDCYRLQRDEGGASMAPTRAVVEDGDVVLRFNVMQGPGQLPLAQGRWRLVAQGPGRAGHLPVVVTSREPLDPLLHGARFAIRSGELRLVPEVEPATGMLTLTVTKVGQARASAIRRTGRIALRPRTLRRAIALGLRHAHRFALRPVRRRRAIAFALLFETALLLVRRDRRQFLFTSDSRADIGGNLGLVYDRMIERGVDRQMLTLFKPGLSAHRSLRDRLRLPWLLARAGTIIIDDYHPIIYRVDDPDARIVQLWHAVGAFKTVGYSRVGKAGAPNPYGVIHKNYTHVIVSSSEDVPIYAEAFGVPEERVVATGIPRTDRFFDPAYREATRERALGEFPEARGRSTILFAPTFRGHGARTATYDLGMLDYAALHALCVAKDAVCIVRMHPFVRDPLGIPPAFADRLLDGQRSPIDVNDLLFAVDLLVTDYSSIVYEFSTLGRPMLFYAYDLDEYVAGRDFYEPYEEFVPGRIVRTFPELLDAIRREDYEIEKVAAFADRHFEHRDGRSTDRVVDLILGG
jgi:CDP-glycerol glycerophosphotransferase (TagB/SpsB family)